MGIAVHVRFQIHTKGQPMRVQSHLRGLAVMAVAIGLSLSLTACGDDEADQKTGSAGGGSSSVEPEPSDDTTPDSDDASETDDTPALDHEGALAAGFAGEQAITCGYTYDEEELVNLRALASGEVPMEATIYLNLGTLLWDMPESGGKMGHLLVHDGNVYTWKVPGDAEGAKGVDTTTDGGADLERRLAANTHDCVIYDGPESIFQPPNDITFRTYEEIVG